MRVPCALTETELDGDYAAVPGVVVNCSRCNNEAECFGTSARSERRALMMLRES